MKRYEVWSKNLALKTEYLEAEYDQLADAKERAQALARNFAVKYPGVGDISVVVWDTFTNREIDWKED